MDWEEKGKFLQLNFFSNQMNISTNNVNVLSLSMWKFYLSLLSLNTIMITLATLPGVQLFIKIFCSLHMLDQPFGGEAAYVTTRILYHSIRAFGLISYSPRLVLWLRTIVVTLWGSAENDGILKGKTSSWRVTWYLNWNFLEDLENILY